MLFGTAFRGVSHCVLPDYVPFMNTVFESRPVAFTEGLAVVAVGVVLLGAVEIEKHVSRILGPD